MMRKILLVCLFSIFSLCIFADNTPIVPDIDADVTIKGYYNPQTATEFSIWPGNLLTELASRVSGRAFNPSVATIIHDGIVDIEDLPEDEAVGVFSWYLKNGSTSSMQVAFYITPLQAEIEIKNSQGVVTGHKFYIPKYTIQMYRADTNTYFASFAYSQIEPYNNSQKGNDGVKGVNGLIYKPKWSGIAKHNGDKAAYGVCYITLEEMTTDPGHFEYISYVTVELSVNT